ncbi:MAG TPA: efflux RND transporter periplasmic adaptor subunit [Candidatus Saccharimonadia bacterium]|nr:efflux RND transporter periplasmic adaptor subunit [Candidatus Saccharimonadia bacterium]
MPPITRSLLLATALVAGPAVAQPGAPGGAPPPTPVETTTPTIAPVRDEVTAVGTLRAAESVMIKPEFPGRIEKIHFDEGQRVAKGAPLFTLDGSLVRAEVREWEANVAQSRREATRAGELSERKLIAQSDLDTKRSELQVNEARLSSAQTRLSKTVIKAPFAGVAGLRDVSPGEYVEVGRTLVTLTQLDPIKLDFRVPEIHLARVAAGQTVDVEVDAFPGQKFTGVVYAVDPQLDPNGRSVVLRATIDNSDDRLKPGLFARVALSFGERASAMLVPEQALWPVGAKQNVFVVEDGKAVLKEVEIGVRRAGMVEIVKGITPQSVVVTAGQIKIGPGAPVQPIPAQVAAKAPAAAAKPAGS